MALGERTVVRSLLGVLIVSAIAATAWIISLPSIAECRLSGRVVDPTERHCESGTTYQQLQEHATFHATQIVVLAVVVLAAAYSIYRLIRRLSQARRRA